MVSLGPVLLAYGAIFLLALLVTKAWQKLAFRAGLTTVDQNKDNKPTIAEPGGLAVLLSFLLAVLGFVFVKTYILESQTHLVETFALLLSTLLAGSLGFVDDVLGGKLGFSQIQKVILTGVVAIPLVVISAGNTTIAVPLIGTITIGLLYPLIIVPIGIIGATNAFNMIAGLNGLEAGMAVIMLATLGIGTYLNNVLWLTSLVFGMVVILLAFLRYNTVPASILVGDSFTYALGAFIATVAILGDVQWLAVFLFLPYFIELVLKYRGKFDVQAFGHPDAGKLYRPYDTIYSLNHIFMTGRSERSIVWTLWSIEMAIAVLAVLVLYW